MENIEDLIIGFLPKLITVNGKTLYDGGLLYEGYFYYSIENEKTILYIHPKFKRELIAIFNIDESTINRVIKKYINQEDVFIAPFNFFFISKI